MKAFADLYRELDASTASRDKQAALQRYLRDADPADAAWAVYFLAGGKPRQLVATRLLRGLAQQAAVLPEWLFDESYQSVGDLAETVSLLLPPSSEPQQRGLSDWLLHHLLPLRELPANALPARTRSSSGVNCQTTSVSSISSSSPAAFGSASRVCRSRRHWQRWRASTRGVWRSGSWATP